MRRYKKKPNIRGNWRLHALCAEDTIDPERFFPKYYGATGLNASDIAKVTAFCSMCSVRIDCLVYALEVEEDHGIYGGFTPAVRRQYAAKHWPGQFYYRSVPLQ